MSITRNCWSPEISTIITLALIESDRHDQKVSYACHLLVAILREGDSCAAKWLQAKGISEKMIREYYRGEASNFLFLNRGIFSRYHALSDEMSDALDRAECLLRREQSLTAGILLLSLLRNPRSAVRKFLTYSDVDVEELDQYLSYLEPVKLEKHSLFNDLLHLMTRK